MQYDGKYRHDADSKSPRCGKDAAQIKAFAMQCKPHAKPIGGHCAVLP